jgi:predicted nuclease with TOPRIM domain
LRIKNNPELERKYEELKEKYNQSEKEKNAYIKKFAADEKRYLDRINKLENIISASDKWDICFRKTK